MNAPPSFDDFDAPKAHGSAVGFVSDNWLRYSAERFASVGLLLILATIAAIAKQRAYRMLLGAGLLSANLALALALLSRWRRPASGAWSLFICCAVILLTAIILAILSAHGMFPVNE